MSPRNLNYILTIFKERLAERETFRRSSIRHFASVEVHLDLYLSTEVWGAINLPFRSSSREDRNQPTFFTENYSQN
jgi:hypothetical protein